MQRYAKRPSDGAYYNWQYGYTPADPATVSASTHQAEIAAAWGVPLEEVEIEDRADGDAPPTASIPAPPLTGHPDGPAFIRAVQAEAFANDLDRIDAVWKLCPLWWPAAKEENWSMVQGVTMRALSRRDITQAEYDAIKASASAHHIPVTL